jgi:hypothetical protein
MEYAISLTGLPDRTLIHCRDVSYSDVKERLLVCAVCEEPILKCGSALTQRQYFAHRKVTLGELGRSDPNICSLRVFQMARAAGHQIIIKQTHLQDLADYLTRFAAIVMERCTLHSDGGRTIPGLLTSMRSRAQYRKWLVTARKEVLPLICLGQDDPVCQNLELRHTYLDKHGNPVTPYVMQSDCHGQDVESMRTVVRFLLGPNCFRALMFSVSYGLMLRQAMTNLEGREEAFEPLLRDRLMTASDRWLQKFASDPPGKKEATERWSRVASMFGYAMCHSAEAFLRAVVETK